jgi:hypothetical protein
MQSLHVNYNDTDGTIARIEDASPEAWETVCERFDNDVQRIMDVADQAGYTALYVCYDETNQPLHYLVEEDQTLMKLRHRTHLSKLGRSLS